MVCLEIVGGLPDGGCWWAGWTGGTRGPPLPVTGREVGPELERFVALHRSLGRVYLILVALGGTGCLFLAPVAEGGLVAKIGFFMLSVL